MFSKLDNNVLILGNLNNNFSFSQIELIVEKLQRVDGVISIDSIETESSEGEKFVKQLNVSYDPEKFLYQNYLSYSKLAKMLDFGNENSRLIYNFVNGSKYVQINNHTFLTSYFQRELLISNIDIFSFSVSVTAFWESENEIQIKCIFDDDWETWSSVRGVSIKRYTPTNLTLAQVLHGEVV